MSDIPDSVLVALRNRERELELEAIAVRARIEEVREAIAVVEHAGRRRGRPRKADIAALSLATEIPQGTLYDPDEGLPSIEEVRGILKQETIA
jgi:hypothetical protein